MDISFNIGLLLIYGVVSFFQSSVFAIVSRSRNSGNSKLHRKVSYISHGAWYLEKVFLIGLASEFIASSNYWAIAAGGLVYAFSAGRGSAFGMKWWAKNIETKDASYKVGAELKEWLK